MAHVYRKVCEWPPTTRSSSGTDLASSWSLYKWKSMKHLKLMWKWKRIDGKYQTLAQILSTPGHQQSERVLSIWSLCESEQVASMTKSDFGTDLASNQVKTVKANVKEKDTSSRSKSGTDPESKASRRKSGRTIPAWVEPGLLLSLIWRKNIVLQKRSTPPGRYRIPSGQGRWWSRHLALSKTWLPSAPPQSRPQMLPRRKNTSPFHCTHVSQIEWIRDNGRNKCKFHFFFQF